MISTKWTILVFVVIFTAFSGGTGEEFDDNDNQKGVMLQNSSSLEAPDEKCSRDKCKGSNCNCCPGYGVKSTGRMWFKTYSCRKCNCGKDFNCKFNNWGTKTCICPDGYKDHYGSCEDKCSLITCKNNGECNIVNKEAVCNCTERYTGDYCDKDKCSFINCENNGTCAIKEGNAVCICTDRYTGDNCKTDKCTQIECQNNGICFIKNEKAICNCTDKYAGDYCETDKCSLISCQNGGKCEVSDGKAKCICTDDHTGEHCEKHKCSLIECLNEGKCEIRNGNATCVCTDAYTGDYCEKDKCSFIQCQNGGKCEIKDGKAVCICLDNYVGDNCEKGCNCKNGKCKEILEKIECNCYPEYGVYEEGICKACECGKDANCTFKDNGFPSLGKTKTCVCLEGFLEADGKCVDPDVHNPCHNDPCKNGAICKKNGVQAECTCLPGYSGKLCEIDVCTPNPCENNGVCQRDTGKAVCRCEDAYTGDRCEKEKCSLIECKNGGNCEIKNENAVCTCLDQYTDDFCQTEKCSLIKCQNGGHCEIKNGEAVCTCPDKYTGDYCEKDKCSLIICNNGGSCEVKNGKGTCICTDEYDGDNCERDKCSLINCQNGGSCGIKDRNAICICTDRYAGEACETDKCSQINCRNDGKCEIRNTKAVCVCSENFTGDMCETDKCSVIECQNGGKCYIKDEKAVCNCSDRFTGDSCEIEITTTQTTTSTAPSTTEETRYKICKMNPCKNGGTCIEDQNGQRCLCSYPYAGKECEEDYWCSGIGRELCNENKCLFDFKTRIGHCSCPEGQFYDYNNRKCRIVDKCPLMPGKCKKINEICRNNECMCKDNYKRNSKNECVPNFCEKMAEKACDANAECNENMKDPENVICKCKPNYVFDGKGCVKVNKCDMPGMLGCQQICEPATESCSCWPGYELKPDEKSCNLKDESYKCSKDCKPGVCYKKADEEVCMCPASHIYKDGTCKDLCTAGSLPSNLCPKDSCESHPIQGFRCKCEGEWTYDVSNVTCRRKLMCSEGGGIQICANKSAKCLEDTELGFKCECAETEEMDEDGVCKNKCELKKHQEACRAKLAECDMQGSKVVCKCPTLLTFNEEGVCTQLATSFSGEIPFDKSIYASKTFFASGGKAPASDYGKMRKDLRDAMLLIYGKNYKFADILKCKDANSSLTCFVEIQFHSDPKDQVKLIGDSGICIPSETNTCLIPPGLILVKENINSALLSKTDPCTESIKQINCGRNETVCRNTTDDNKNFECACAAGFESYGTIYPVSDRRTVIHKCQDIDECLLQKACPNRTRCINTYGSYECFCQQGFKPVSAAANPKSSGCVAVCGPNTCGDGVCEMDGYYYTCRCNDGYTGTDCKQKIEMSEEHKGAEIALIALSTIVIPLILFAIYMIHKYKVINKKRERLNSLDDSRSTLSMQLLTPGVGE